MSETRFIYGFHAVLAKLRHQPEAVTEIFVDAARNDGRMRDLLKAAEFRQIRIISSESHRLTAIAGNAARHQGVIANVRTDIRAPDLSDVLDTLEEPPFLLVLDGVQDPHNLGACLRVADAVGAHAVIAPKDRAVGLTQTVLKVASGAAESVPYITVTNLARTLRELKERDIWIIGADSNAENDIYAANFPSPAAFVFGSEGEGLRRLTRDSCDLLVKLPMLGSVESLNVSVSVGICLYEARRRFNLPPI